MKQHPHETAVVFSAPQGWGKTLKARELMKQYGVKKLNDDWLPCDHIAADTLHLTCAHPDELKHLRCKVVSKGW